MRPRKPTLAVSKCAGTDGAWWVIEAVESGNGDRWGIIGVTGKLQLWCSDQGFGWQTYSHYENTPVGAVTHTDEPGPAGVNDAPTYFGL